MARVAAAGAAAAPKATAPLAWWKAWLAGVGLTAALYAAGGRLGGAPHVLPELELDRFIGFHPAGVWLYLSFFGFQALGFLLIPADRRLALVKCFTTCACVAFVVFLLYPTTLVQPPFSDAAMDLGLRLVRFVDTPGNCLPSLHAALSAVSAAAISANRKGRIRLLAWTWAVGICWSAIATRQHLSIDIAAGWLLGCVAVQCFLRKQRVPGEYEATFT